MKPLMMSRSRLGHDRRLGSCASARNGKAFKLRFGADRLFSSGRQEHSPLQSTRKTTASFPAMTAEYHLTPAICGSQVVGAVLRSSSSARWGWNELARICRAVGSFVVVGQTRGLGSIFSSSECADSTPYSLSSSRAACPRPWGAF